MHSKKVQLGTKLLGGAGIFFILVFIGFKVAPLIRGTIIDFKMTPDATGGAVALTGSAANAVALSINGNAVMLDESGNWNDTLLLPPGSTTVLLSARDKFGRTNTTTMHLYQPLSAFAEKATPAAASNPIINHYQ